MQEALERFEDYYAINMKPTKSIISANEYFFDSLSTIKKITVIGHSLAKVDMPYFEKINEKVGDDVVWEFSFHTKNDKRRIDSFCKRFSITSDRRNDFEL